jgi:hypothetical protein
MSGQQSPAKSPRLLPGHSLCQKQPQVPTSSACFQIGGNVLVGQRSGQVAQALPTLLVVSIQNEKPCLTLLVEQIGSQSNLTPQAVKQEAHVQGLTHADIAAIVKLVGVQIPALDKLLGQHQGWAREFCSELEVSFQDVERRAEEIPNSEVIPRFLTPTRIKHEGRFISQPPFHVIVRNVLRRVSSLYYFHCGEQWEFDYRGTIERAKEIRSAELNTRWVDWERYSGRQKARMKMGGFVGEAIYQGDLTGFKPLLVLGQLVHIGKACVFGNGRYEIG